jgi:hypothetical protein
MLSDVPEVQPKSIIEAILGGRLELRWAPFDPSKRPALCTVENSWFRMDQWAKIHPIFEGLPAGGLMDQIFYQDILSDQILDMESASECVSGAVLASVANWPDNPYASAGAGLMVSVHQHGAGRFILNTLKIRENLGKVPAAERLLRNMLNHAAQDIAQPLAP